MYPLPVILVGCGESIRANVRRNLGNLQAIVKGEFRDVTAVLQKYYQKDDGTPFLLLLYVRTPEDLQQLQRLSASLPGKPILALRDRDSDQAMFLGALRAGAAFAVPVPLDPEDFKTALTWIGRQFGYEPKVTPVLAVAGVNGGCGASTLALNLADAIGARHMKHVLLVDLSLRMGMIATYLHVEPPCSIHHLIAEADNLDIDLVRQSFARVNDHLDLLAGPQQAIHSQNVTPDDVFRVLQYARALADVVVLDLPCTYDDMYFETMARADEVLLVWEQKVPSVRALQMVRDALHRKHVPTERQTLIVNRYDPRVKGFSVPELEELLHVKGVRTVANDYAAISASHNDGRPLREQAPSSSALADINTLAAAVLRLPKGSRPAANETVFTRMVRAFGLTS